MEASQVPCGPSNDSLSGVIIIMILTEARGTGRRESKNKRVAGKSGAGKECKLDSRADVTVSDQQLQKAID